MTYFKPDFTIGIPVLEVNAIRCPGHPPIRYLSSCQLSRSGRGVGAYTRVEYVASRGDEPDSTPCGDVDDLGGVGDAIVEASHVHACHVHKLCMQELVKVHSGGHSHTNGVSCGVLGSLDRPYVLEW